MSCQPRPTPPSRRASEWGVRASIADTSTMPTALEMAFGKPRSQATKPGGDVPQTELRLHRSPLCVFVLAPGAAVP